MQGLKSRGFIAFFLAFFPFAAGAIIRIAGSSAIYPFAATVAEHMGDLYHQPIPLVESIGTGSGIRLFCAGLQDKYPHIATASRPMTKEERKICQDNGVLEIEEFVVGLDGIVIGTSKNFPSLDLKREDLFKALSYKIPQNISRNKLSLWQEVRSDLPHLPILVMGPSAVSGTREAFINFVFSPFCTMGGECLRLRSDGRYISAGDNENLIIQKLQVTPHLVGIFSFSFLEENRDKLKAFTIDGVHPTYKTIVEGKYPLARPLFLYVKRKKVKEMPALKTYLKVFLSEEASGSYGYLREKGLIPLSEKKRQAMRERLEAL